MDQGDEKTNPISTEINDHPNNNPGSKFPRPPPAPFGLSQTSKQPLGGSLSQHLDNILGAASAGSVSPRPLPPFGLAQISQLPLGGMLSQHLDSIVAAASRINAYLNNHSVALQLQQENQQAGQRAQRIQQQVQEAQRQVQQDQRQVQLLQQQAQQTQQQIQQVQQQAQQAQQLQQYRQPQQPQQSPPLPTATSNSPDPAIANPSPSPSSSVRRLLSPLQRTHIQSQTPPARTSRPTPNSAPRLTGSNVRAQIPSGSAVQRQAASQPAIQPSPETALTAGDQYRAITEAADIARLQALKEGTDPNRITRGSSLREYPRPGSALEAQQPRAKQDTTKRKRQDSDLVSTEDPEEGPSTAPSGGSSKNSKGKAAKKDDSDSSHSVAKRRKNNKDDQNRPTGGGKTP
ncbi:uncharacterized protein BDV17DRAFT_288711 [Aspergillus undulatus]|uniref:uncharacterized protein n=1 Tax=Aspergillus undulatus TaxID=1810928 RepID=UPI003CCCBA6A